LLQRRHLRANYPIRRSLRRRCLYPKRSLRVNLLMSLSPAVNPKHQVLLPGIDASAWPTVNSLITEELVASSHL
jgi:hypothetical protein